MEGISFYSGVLYTRNNIISYLYTRMYFLYIYFFSFLLETIYKQLLYSVNIYI